MISAQDRRQAVELIDEAVTAGARAVAACECVGLAFSTYHKWKHCPEQKDGRQTRQFEPNERALSPQERQQVLDYFCHPSVCDMSVRQAFFAYLDKGIYLASESTVYRILREANLNVRRDGVRLGVKRNKPSSFEATGPNQVWSWDITYMRDAQHSTRFYYVFAVVDIYSRYLVHYDVFESETAENAVKFLSDAMDKYHIAPRCLVLHSDNGAAMKAATTMALLESRGVTFSHSRPRVSNDNP